MNFNSFGMRWKDRLAAAGGNAGKVFGMALHIAGKKQLNEMEQADEEVPRVKKHIQARNVYLQQELPEGRRCGEIVGNSKAILHVLRQVERVAPTHQTVLILGETGTGKDLLARTVHARSGRSNRPLVRLNCAALPAALVENELFGHEKGAFTGAVSKRVGRFELADHGTLFLDEIGELPLELQGKLLRVLQEGELVRVGSGETIKVDVRVIAATNRDLHRAVHEKRFREDLYFRLNVCPILMPPLRERKEDIGTLAAAFLAEIARRLGRPLGGLQHQFVETLQQHDWPGNVRELQNVIERAAVLSKGPLLELPERWTASRIAARRRSAPRPCGRSTGV